MECVFTIAGIRNLARCRQMSGISLEIPLSSLAIVRGGKGDYTADTRIQALCNPLDGAPFAGGVAALEQNHHFLPTGDDPVLELHQLGLKPEELLEVGVPCFALIIRSKGSALRGVAVFDLELELLIVAVDQILTQSAQQFFVIK